MHFDLWKHLATLDSGAIALIAVMGEKLFPGAGHRGWLAAAVVCFLLSIVGSVALMADALLDIAESAADGWQVPPLANSARGWFGLASLAAAFLGFAGGMVCLGVFAILCV